jgi:hypothetical protein
MLWVMLSTAVKIRLVVLNQISNNKDLLLSIFFHPATENKTRTVFFPFNSVFAKIIVVIEHSWVITF